MNINEIIETIKPSEILVKSSNYIQCIINDIFCEFQYCYITKNWYQFKTIGTSDAPTELFIKWLK